MDIEQEARKLGGNPIIRYAPLLIGLLVVAAAAGLGTWKRSALEEARGNLLAVEHRIETLKERALKEEDSGRVDRINEEIKTLTEKARPSAEKEVEAERVDAANGVWFLEMSKWIGLTIASLGFVALAALGSHHERIGALIGLAYILVRLA